MRRLATILSTLLLAVGLQAQAPQTKTPLNVLFVGTAKTARTQVFKNWLGARFTNVRVAERKSFDPSEAAKVDVVILDWSQGDQSDFGLDSSPLGKREDWKTPTVFLGSAGLLMATRWKLEGWFG